MILIEILFIWKGVCQKKIGFILRLVFRLLPVPVSGLNNMTNLIEVGLKLCQEGYSYKRVMAKQTIRMAGDLSSLVHLLWNCWKFHQLNLHFLKIFKSFPLVATCTRSRSILHNFYIPNKNTAKVFPFFLHFFSYKIREAIIPEINSVEWKFFFENSPLFFLCLYLH